jgi:hypothetical protein
MNSVFTLLVLTAPGVINEAYTFQSLQQCEMVKAQFSVRGVCVEKKEVDMQEHFRKMITMMKEMKNEFEKNP